MAPITEEEFVKLVKRMRDQQKRFFKARHLGSEAERKSALVESKKLESEVDNIIEQALNPNVGVQQSLL